MKKESRPRKQTGGRPSIDLPYNRLGGEEGTHDACAKGSKLNKRGPSERSMRKGEPGLRWARSSGRTGRRENDEFSGRMGRRTIEVCYTGLKSVEDRRGGSKRERNKG